MQRKNNFLGHSQHKMKNAMALIMAIGVIVVIGTIMALSLSLTSQTTKRTNDLYLYEQAVLLSKSATEYALLKIAQDGACSHTNDLVFTQDSFYDINISLLYIYEGTTNPCSASQTFTTVQTPEQNGSILIDVAVKISDPSIVTEPIRYSKRTLQKL
jgi:hypothetical protein